VAFFDHRDSAEIMHWKYSNFVSSGGSSFGCDITKSEAILEIVMYKVEYNLPNSFSFSQRSLKMPGATESSKHLQFVIIFGE